MVNCTRRQTIVRRNSDGTESIRQKCINGMACTFNTTVTNETCSQCVLAQTRDCHCHLIPPLHPTFNQPVFDLEKNVCYDTGLPPCPYGYSATDNPLVFKSTWSDCPYLEFSNELNQDGSLKVVGFCSITNKITCPASCKECDGAVSNISPKEYPSLATELNTYLYAVKNWIQEGRPTRTDAEVKHLHDQYCSKCDWYDTEQQRCKGCGCKTRAEGAALLNKLRMSTQHCPKQLW